MKCYLTCIANILCYIAAINWGLVAYFKFNLVEFIAKYIPIPKLKLILYTLIALSGLALLVGSFFGCKFLLYCKR